MAGIKLEGFQGLIPRTSERLLPPMNATVARNTKLTSGELRGFRQLQEIADLSAQASPLRRAFRVPDTPTDAWLAFDSQDVDVIRSPLVNDAYDRYFWAGDGRPMMNTGAQIKAGQVDGPYYLGIPTPASAPTVTPPGGSAETRAYVFTFQSVYGEEGPPSPPTTATGDAGTWVIGNLPATEPDSGFRNVDKINIYRTVPGNATSSFFYVDTVVKSGGSFPSSYNDTLASADVAQNNLLDSTTWAEPPTTLEGFVLMPNGYLVGWVGRRIVFSEPYLPHAWPAQYELSTEFEVVGMGVFGSTLVIGTTSSPYFGAGVSPAAFTMQKLDAVEPCLSRQGIVSTVAGVIYPSINGLVLCNGSGAQVVTKDLFSKSEWSNLQPENIYAANLGLQYIAFNSTNFGFIIDPENPSQRHVELDNFTNVEGIETDRYTGNVNLLSNDRVWNWDPETNFRLQWRWKSRWFQTPKPINFGAMRLKFVPGTGQSSYDIDGVYRPYNEALFTAINGLNGSLKRLNTLNGQVLGGSPARPDTGLVPTYTPPLIENKQPLGGSLLYDLAYLSLTVQSVRVLLWTRREGEVETNVYDRTVTSESIHRLPTGFKSDLWQIELIGNTTVYSLQIAETPNGLAEI